MSLTWANVAAILGAIVLIGNALEKIIKAVQALRSPENRQNEAIIELQERVEEIERKLVNDKYRLDRSDAASRVSQVALIALLEHGINGNNIDQMQQAKKTLQEFLVNHE